MPFVDRNAVVRFDLPAPDEGEWVEIRKELAAGDDLLLQKRMLDAARLRQAGPDEEVLVKGMTFDPSDASTAYQLAQLEIGIARWSFPREVTMANLAELLDASFDNIKACYESVHPKRADDEGNDSSSTSSRPSTGTEVATLPS